MRRSQIAFAYARYWSAKQRLQSQFFFDLLYAFEKFSEPVDPGDLSLCFLKRTRGRTEPGASGSALRDTALRANRRAVANFEVAYNANLPPHHDALTHTRTA